MSGDTHGGDRIDFRNGTFRGEAIGKKVEHHHHYGPMPHVGDALPPAVAEFTGRGDELASLLAVAGAAGTPAAVTAVAGPGGVGKTASAVRPAHAARGRGWFPGGALFVDCHGYDETPAGPEQLLEALLRALGVAPPGTGALPRRELNTLLRARLVCHNSRKLLMEGLIRDAERVAETARERQGS
ncbi:hypothetical protein ACWEKM_26265 [Streptomyces sp. NPDC004752]